jgi:putative redox protein
MISILKKQRQEIASFKAEVEGERVQVGEAKPFKDIYVVFYLEGNIKGDKAAKAAQLSFEKYCSVSKTLEPTATIHYKVVLNGETLSK